MGEGSVSVHRWDHTGPFLDQEGEISRSALIETICQGLIEELKYQKLSAGNWDYLEPHALEITQHIQNSQIRNLHIMEG